MYLSLKLRWFPYRPDISTSFRPGLTFQASSCQSLYWVAVKLTRFKRFTSSHAGLRSRATRLPNILMETFLAELCPRVVWYPIKATRSVNKVRESVACFTDVLVVFVFIGVHSVVVSERCHYQSHGLMK